MSLLLELFISFFKVGAFTYGGGYAMLPILQKETVTVKKWVTETEILDIYAVGQSVPGIIAINSASFIGYKIKKIPGAIAATAGMVMPSLIIIITIASLFTKFREIPQVQSALKGVTAAVVALIFDAVIKMGKKTLKGWIGKVISIAAFCSMVFFEISPPYIIIAAGIIGFANYKLGGKKK